MVRVSLVCLLCVACGPPRVAASTSDGESSDSSTGSSSSDTSSSDTSSTDDGSTTSDTSESSIIPPYDQSWDSGCDPFEQDCPDGEKCVPYSSTGGSSWDDNKCVTVLGSQATGEPCTFGGIVEATDDCDATGFCWNAQEVDGELLGTCHSFCGGSLDTPECPDGSECVISSDPVVTLCIPWCDPVAQDCDDGLGCYWTGTAFNCAWTADPPGIPLGQPCRFANACEAGSLCVDASMMPDCAGTGCCGSYCGLSLGDAQCDAVPGTLCVPFWEQGMAPAGYEDVGICIVGP
jgi:hypothetical protein